MSFPITVDFLYPQLRRYLKESDTTVEGTYNKVHVISVISKYI